VINFHRAHINFITRPSLGSRI